MWRAATFKPPPLSLWRRGGLWGGQGCIARGHGDGPCVVRRVRCVMSSQVVPEGVGERPEEAAVACGGACGWGRGLRAVVGVELPAVEAAGEAVCGP